MEEYILNSETYKNKTYNALSSKEVKQMFSEWVKLLSSYQKWLFFIYRCSSKKINRKLRAGENNRVFTEMTKAIKMAELKNNILVYRKIDKQEEIIMQKYEVGEKFILKGFKSTHVGKTIKIVFKNSKPRGYIIFLLPKGAPVAYINFLCKIFWWEKELVINNEQKYELIRRDNILGRNAYFIRLINNDE